MAVSCIRLWHALLLSTSCSLDALSLQGLLCWGGQLCMRYHQPIRFMLHLVGLHCPADQMAGSLLCVQDDLPDGAVRLPPGHISNESTAQWRIYTATAHRMSTQVGQQGCMEYHHNLQTFKPHCEHSKTSFASPTQYETQHYGGMLHFCLFDQL